MPIKSKYHRHLLLITGCGRAGTLYASKVWQTVGLDIRHERPVAPNGVVGVHGIASWLMAVDDPCPPHGPSALDHEFEWTIHQTRHPLQNISSAAQFLLSRKVAWDYVARNYPPIGIGLPRFDIMIKSKENMLLSAMRYWLHWNLFAESNAMIHVRVEDLASRLPSLMHKLSIKSEAYELDTIPRDVNSRKQYINEENWHVTWSDLKQLDRKLVSDIQLKAEQYGYE